MFFSLNKEQKELSTPHGALGTKGFAILFKDYDSSFNSTRCIRNEFDFEQAIKRTLLSTPHGALGTAVSQT